MIGFNRKEKKMPKYQCQYPLDSARGKSNFNGKSLHKKHSLDSIAADYYSLILLLSFLLLFFSPHLSEPITSASSLGLQYPTNLALQLPGC